MTVGENDAAQEHELVAHQRSFGGEITAYYQAVLDNLHWPGGGNGDRVAVRTLGVTSYRRGEGVTTVAAGLAATAAASEHGPVLLVEVSTEPPTLHEVFDLPMPVPESSANGNGNGNGNGYGERRFAAPIAMGEAAPADAELPIQVERAAQPTAVSNLHLLSSEAIAPSQHGRLAIDRIAQAAAAATSKFELVVLDLPAAGTRSAAIHLAGLLDGVLLVVEAEGVRWESVNRLRQLLDRAGANVAGAILNKRRRYTPRWFEEDDE